MSQWEEAVAPLVSTLRACQIAGLPPTFQLDMVALMIEVLLGMARTLDKAGVQRIGGGDDSA